MNNGPFVDKMIEEARGLKSEDGENREYDRALVELVTFASCGTCEDFNDAAKEIGIVNWRTRS